MDQPTNEQLAVLAKAGDVDARNQLILNTVRLVLKLGVPRHYFVTGTASDFLTDAVFNILRAIDKFDPSRGCKFSTFVGNQGRFMFLTVARQDAKRLADSAIPIDLLQVPATPNVADATPNVATPACGCLDRAIRDASMSDACRYAILGRLQGRTLADIGSYLGLSKQRVGQLQAKAVDALTVPGGRWCSDCRDRMDQAKRAAKRLGRRQLRSRSGKREDFP